MADPKKKSSLLMKLFKGFIALTLLFAVAIAAITAFVLDGKYAVERSTVIDASPAAIHKQVGDLREWPNWLPFTKHDKSVKTTIEKPTGVGAHQHWTSDNGNGKLTFTSWSEDQGVEFDMLFDEKWASKGALKYADAGGGKTKVTWSMTGHNEGVFGKWFAAATKPMMEPMFDEGLADLKKKVETK